MYLQIVRLHVYLNISSHYFSQIFCNSNYVLEGKYSDTKNKLEVVRGEEGGINEIEIGKRNKEV